MIWKERRVLLIILGALLVANTLFFFTYRVQYQSRLDALDTRLEAAEQELTRVKASRESAELTLRNYRNVERDVLEVFNAHWSTRPERLTLLIAEVKRLAVASNLIPASYSFAQTEGRTLTSGRRPDREDLGANEVGISFTVQGNYQQARRLINLLELSQQFVIIESIRLAAADDRTLTLNLQLKTLFRDMGGPRGSENRL
jgi:hypothetical protein